MLLAKLLQSGELARDAGCSRSISAGHPKSNGRQGSVHRRLFPKLLQVTSTPICISFWGFRTIKSTKTQNKPKKSTTNGVQSHPSLPSSPVGLLGSRRICSRQHRRSRRRAEVVYAWQSSWRAKELIKIRPRVRSLFDGSVKGLLVSI